MGVLRFQAEEVLAVLTASVLETCRIQFAAILNPSCSFTAVTIWT